MGFRFVWIPCRLSVSDEYLKGRGRQDGIYRCNLCRKGTESGYRCEGSAHAAPNTSSYMNTRSISQRTVESAPFGARVVIDKEAKKSKSAVSCQSLMLDSESRSDTIPAMDIRTKDAAVGHEAKIGSISDDAVFYLNVSEA